MFIKNNLKINICGKLYTINLHEEEIRENNELVWGNIDFKTQNINIYKNLDSSRIFSILMHEIIHGVCDAANVDCKEKDVDRIANILSDTLIRNNIYSLCIE